MNPYTSASKNTLYFSLLIIVCYNVNNMEETKDDHTI